MSSYETNGTALVHRQGPVCSAPLRIFSTHALALIQHTVSASIRSRTSDDKIKTPQRKRTPGKSSRNNAASRPRVIFTPTHCQIALHTSHL